MAAAEEPDNRTTLFSGFGTLGLAHSSLDKADFVADTLTPEGPGHSHRWSPELDSTIGGQVTADFLERWSAVLQVISEQRADKTFKPSVEWANIKYAFSPDLSVRAGRTVLPVFLTSDARKVGYANLWVRPPVELYSLVPISNNDGIDATYRTRLGGTTSTLQALYGSKTIATVAGSTAHAKHTRDLSDTLEVGALTVHSTYHQVSVSVAEGIPYSAIKLLTLGATYDPGNWLITAEWARNRSEALGNSNAWYVTGGYRIAAFTPYVTYSRLLSKSLPGLGFPPATQRNASAGARWDFMKNVDLKVQYERITVGAGSAGTFTNFQPGFEPGQRVALISAVIDFVF